ncbi:amino acid transporter [Paraphaeosphaeria sporulosa]|uniref:Amino acid transporter n=1 Tax=Paraphaeosphaeria sporulosa TaxID=1460663 RepID=A0A177CFJ2_9PLEO|nr:amino acid transporter [Paraphaeosphaeria sporulosa]OAG06374.1 amino acid transporter [Paraphaeosphaeria sporulosa]
MASQGPERDGNDAGHLLNKPSSSETQPLLDPRTSTASHHSGESATKQLTARHAFAVLVTLQIGSGIFASPSQVDSNVPSPGAALLVWALGGLLSWAGAASFAELGAAIPLNGGMQAYLAYVYGDTMAFLMAWIYIMAAKPAAMAIQSIVIAESIGSISSSPTAAWVLKLVAALTFVAMVLVNSINTRVTIRLSESFTGIKLMTVFLVVIAGLVAVIAHLVNPKSSLSGGEDWHSKNWFSTRPTFYEGHTIDWTSMSTWDRYGHYSAAIYGGLWAFDGWDNANVVASEIRNPGQALPKAIKAAMIVVLGSYELVNLAYYILLPWSTVSSSDAVAVVALGSAFGRWAGILMSILVAVSCAGSITSNVFVVGRLTVAASERQYLPAILGERGLPWRQSQATIQCDDPGIDSQANGIAVQNQDKLSRFDAPIWANVLALVLTLVYILTGSFRTLLTFASMAMWVFYISTVLGLLILRRREPALHRPYKPAVTLPAIFVVSGTFILLRSAIFAPVQAGVLACLLIIGTSISKLRTR